MSDDDTDEWDTTDLCEDCGGPLTDQVEIERGVCDFCESQRLCDDD